MSLELYCFKLCLTSTHLTPHLPHRTASPTFRQYQIMLHGGTDTCMTVCE